MRPYLVQGDASATAWQSKTLRELGRDERFLEQVIAAAPHLLGLDPYETGVAGPTVAISQRVLSTPTGRDVRPDLVLLSESGHIVVIEVKLSDNAELRDRRVVAQVIEYAASVASLSDEQAVEWLGEVSDGSWTDAVRRWFPGAESAERLGDALRRRMRQAEIHLVIVSDGAPDGLRDLVRAVAGQAALGEFRLHVVELNPYVAHGVEGVLLVPSALARTEIVARTAITVSYEVGSAQPSVSVVASSPAEVEEAIAEARAGTIDPTLLAVVAAYDSAAPPELRTVGRAAKYRQIRMPGWPSGLHYEFMSRGRERVSVELHVESPALGLISAAIPALTERVRSTMPAVVHDPSWRGGLGRLFVVVPASDVTQAARSMTTLIGTTQEAVGKLVTEL
jgi:hypothetical protein